MTDELPIWCTEIEDAGLQQTIIAVGADFDADVVDVVVHGKVYRAPIEAIDIIAPPVWR